MENKIKQKELNISFYVTKTKEIKKKIKKEIEKLKIIKENGKNHAELWIDIYEFCMKKPELFKKYRSNCLIKEFKFNDISVLKQQIIELVKEIIDGCNWYDSDIKTIYMTLCTDYYLLKLLSDSIDFKKYQKIGIKPPLFCDDIDNSLKEYCKQHNIELKISGLHSQNFGVENTYDNDFILDLTKETKLISQINNFKYYLNKINFKFINNFDFFDIGIKFRFLYDWLISKWTNIKNLLEFYEQIIKLIEEQEKISESRKINIKFNSKKHTYISHIYSIIYEFLKLQKDNSLPFILNESIKLIKENNIINCNIDNPLQFEKVKETDMDKIILKFKNDFFNKFIDYVWKFQIRNSTFHLNNKRIDSPWYKDVLIDKIDKLSSWTVDDIKQVITYLKNLIIKPYSFLWNFMRKITNNKLILSFDELLKIYF